MSKPSALTLLLAALAFSSQVQATVTHVGTTPAGTATAVACAGTGMSGGPGPGFHYNQGNSTGTAVCNGGAAASPGVATGSATQNGVSNGQNYTASGSAAASLGIIKMTGATTGNTATQFAGANISAGWNDRFTLTGGGSGSSVWVVPMQVTGEMASAGLGSWGRTYLRAYLGSSVINTGSAYTLFDTLNVQRNGAIYFSWADEMMAWGTTDTSPDTADVLNLSINQVVWFAIPFTWGTPFQAGFWGEITVGQSSSGGFYSGIPTNSTTADLGNTITWGGKGYVVNGDNSTTTSFSVSADSGFNYNDAVVPEPSTWAMGISGALALGVLARRRAQ